MKIFGYEIKLPSSSGPVEKKQKEGQGVGVLQGVGKIVSTKLDTVKTTRIMRVFKRRVKGISDDTFGEWKKERAQAVANWISVEENVQKAAEFVQTLSGSDKKVGIETYVKTLVEGGAAAKAAQFVQALGVGIQGKDMALNALRGESAFTIGYGQLCKSLMGNINIAQEATTFVGSLKEDQKIFAGEKNAKGKDIPVYGTTCLFIQQIFNKIPADTLVLLNDVHREIQRMGGLVSGENEAQGYPLNAFFLRFITPPLVSGDEKLKKLAKGLMSTVAPAQWSAEPWNGKIDERNKQILNQYATQLLGEKQ